MHKILKNYFSIIKKLLPQQNIGNSIGIDIGSADIKFVEIEKKGNSYEIKKWGIEVIEGGNVLTSIKNVMAKLGGTSKSVYTSVFGKGTLIRYINMPKMSIEDLRSSFTFEVDKYFPFAQDQIYTDCFIIDDKTKGKQMSVMAAASKKEIVDQRIKLLNDLGIQSEFIGINPIALANVINVMGGEDSDEKKPAIALLDLGESASNLTILLHRLPRFTRDIFIGGRDLTKSISNSLGVDFAEAEKLKRNPGKKLDKVLNACENAVMNIVKELRLSFDYFTTENNIEISKIYLTGGAAMLDGLTDVFEKNFDVKVEMWNPVDTFKVNGEADRDELNKQSLKFGVALGLALYNYDRD